MALGKFANRIVGSGEESLDQIQFNPRNWRVHPLNQQNALKGVLEEVGWVQEVIVNKRTGNLIDGHLRCQLAAREGAKTIPVKYVDLSEEEEGLILSTLDPIAAMAATDKAKLDELFAGIETENADVLKMLDDIAEKERLEYAKRDPVDAEPQIDRAAELNEKWQVVTGDLWQIGGHRLLCGDSTKREDVERVMGGEKADMVFTDQPYNVASESRNYAADKSKAMKDLSQSEWDKNFDITAVFPMLDEILAQDCAVYVCTSHWLVHTIWTWMWKWSDFCSYCVWCKPNPMPSLSKRHWTWATELIPYAVRGKHISNFPNDGHALNWWAIPKDKDTEHPTEKVLEVPTRAIQFSSNKGAIVFDGFCGSGTTMVACQNLNRKCRAIEISPNYCAVILERMATAFPELEIKKVD